MEVWSTNSTNASWPNYKFAFVNNRDTLFVMSLIICSVCVLGLPLIFTNMTVFSHKSFKEKVFVYLNYESYFMALNLIISAFLPVYRCYVCSVSKSLWAVVYQKFLVIYAISITEMGALYSEIFATVCCICILEPNTYRVFLFFNRVNKYLVFVFEVVTSGALFAYQLFEYDIIRLNQTNDYYLIVTDFGQSELNSVFQIVVFSIRDGFLLLILIVANVYMMFVAKKSLNNKMKILKGHSKQSQIRKTQTHLTTMVLADSVVYVCARMPILVFNAGIRQIGIFNYNYDVVINSIIVIIRTSYGLKFFLYYTFNRRFRNHLVNNWTRSLLGKSFYRSTDS